MGVWGASPASVFVECRTMTWPDRHNPLDGPPVFEVLEPRVLFAATPLGEAGSVTFSQAGATSWLTVELHRDYVNPVVIATAQSVNDADPFTLRVRNITAGSFELQIDEWDYLDGTHGTETIGYLVIEAGTHTLDDGTLIQAGFASADDGTTAVALPVAHSATPVVFTQVSSVNEDEAVVTRNNSVTAGGFTVELMEQEPTKGPHVAETVGWVSIDAALGFTGERLFEAGDTGDLVTHVAVAQGLTQAFAGTPVVLAGMQSLDGGDPAATHVLNPGASGFDVRVQEEQAGDTDTSHTTENIGYLAWSTGLINLGTNTSPAAGNDAYGVGEDGVLNVAALAGVLANDSDPELGPLSAVLVSGPSDGSLVLNADGGFTYTPDADFFGTDTFTYQAVDLEGAAIPATVTITVNAVDDAPVAVGDVFTVDEDAALVGSVAGNDVEVDGDAVSFALVAGPASGVLDFDAAGGFTYTPTANFFGSDAFTYRVTDIHGNSDTAVATITVDPVNDAPTLSFVGMLGIGADDPAVIIYSLGDVDAGGAGLRVTVSVDGGFVSLPSASGVTWLVGDGDADATVALQGTLTQLAQALGNVRVTADGDLTGIRVTVTIDDLGASGGGGALTDSVETDVVIRLVGAPASTLPGLEASAIAWSGVPDRGLSARQRLAGAAASSEAAGPVGYGVERTLVAWPGGVWLAVNEVEDASRSRAAAAVEAEQVRDAGVDWRRAVEAHHDNAGEEVAERSTDGVEMPRGGALQESEAIPKDRWLDDASRLADVPVLPGRVFTWGEAVGGVVLWAWVKGRQAWRSRTGGSDSGEGLRVGSCGHGRKRPWHPRRSGVWR